MKLWKIGNHIKLYSLKSKFFNQCIDTKHSTIISETKETIDDYKHIWEQYKKKANEYEYIYTSSNNPKNVCKLSVISRSFFKLHELIHDLNIKLDEKDTYTCLAEGPGGFIQSLLYNTKGNPRIYGITLLSKNKRVPYWSPLISNHAAVTILTGVDKTGDLLYKENVNAFIETIGKHTCHIVTSDGGIDYSIDYNRQELLSYELSYSEIFINLHIQKEKGWFIIKLFDIFHYKTLCLLYLLYMCYDEIYITKPNTSRLSNSEKYIVCKGFQTESSKMFIRHMDHYFNKKHDFQLFIPRSFIKNIIEYNKLYTDSQQFSIYKTIKMIQSKETINTYSKIKLANEWCLQYNLPIKN